jgi:peptidoglycan/LPS O-acetylase OafA/YrhL
MDREPVMIQPLTAPAQPRTLAEKEPFPLGGAPISREVPSTARQRLSFIDGLRGLAMLMVLAFHSWLSSGVLVPVTIGRWHLEATFLLQHGYLGVHLFLVLSGFCLTYPLARAGAAGMRLDGRRFFRRRAWRILPPYYVALAFFSLRPALEIALRSALGHPGPSVHPYTAGQILSHLFMVHNFSQAWVRSIDGSFWSLALEWQLYLIFPVLIGSIRRWGPARVLAAVLALSLVYRSWVYATHVGPGSQLCRPYSAPLMTACLFTYPQVPGRLFEFVLGMMAALALARRRKIPSPVRTRRYLGGFVALGILGIGVSHGWSPYAPITDVIWGLAFYCLVMYAAGRSAAGGGWLDSRPLAALGTISYSVYLIHEPLMRFAEGVLGPRHLAPAVSVLLFAFVIAPLTMGCGWLFYRAVEARFIRSGGTR